MSLRRRMGPAPRLRPVPPARPVHAGRLAGWERLAFALAFALMMAFVVVITVSSARAHGRGATGGPPGTPSSAGQPPLPAARPRSGSGAGLGAGSGSGAGPGAPGQTAGRAARAAWDHRLAVAIAPVVQGRAGGLAVGVVDAATGAAAVYGRRLRFQAASIVKPEILAALLLRARHAPAGVSNSDAGLATQMIEASDRVAANRLWDLAGRAGGLAAADVVLGLRHTTPGPAESWGLTTTTVGDQLTLLADLTTAKSPLSSAERAYVLSLMRAVGPAQRWGVSAAASPGGVLAIKNGWRLDGPARLWVVNSIGVVRRNGQRLLMAVLMRGQPTRAAGIAAADAAAVAAADCMTSGG